MSLRFTTKLISSLDIIFNQIGGDFLKNNLEDYCFLESAVSKYSFIANDGSFVSIVSIDGLKKVVDENELNIIVNDLYSKTKPFFKEKGHSIQCCFLKDSERTKEQLEHLLSPYKLEAKRMQMNADYLFDSKVEYLEKFTTFEENLLVLWSRPTLISNSIKSETKEICNELEKYPIFEKGQNFLLEYKTLKFKHESFFKSMLNTLKGVGFSTKILNCFEQSNKIRSSISSDLTSKKWKARIPESKRPVIRENENDITLKEDDISYLLYPNLKQQLIPSNITLDNNILKVGDKFVSSIFIDIPQEEPKSFTEFLKKLDKDVPFQISFKIDGGGLSNVGLKKFLATMTSFHPTNRLIRESLQWYQNKDISGDTITKNSITLNTWGNNPDELSKRKNDLLKSLQSWGSMTPRFFDDDHYESFFASIPAFTPKMSGNNFIDTLDSMYIMMPFSRQANIWDFGCVLDRTHDGKIMPYQVLSSLQPSWNEITIAKSGSGKSVRSNYVNWSFCLTPKSSGIIKGKLPYIGIIDIGPSSLGLIKLLKTVLPKNRHDEVIYHRLSNSEEDSINILDTQLGCRYPNNKEKEFIINFISLILTPSGGETPEGIDSMINSILLELYKEYSDIKSPKPYEQFEIPLVDKKLKELGISPDNRSWWWVVDELFKIKEYKLAKLAQTMAVPTLDDVVKIANISESIVSMYSKPIKQSSGENFLQFFNRSMAEAITMYPLLNNPTKLDLSDARIISLDLNDVAQEGDVGAKKKAAIMYMLARFTVTRNFFLEPKTYTFAPALYKDYLLNKTKESKVTPKRLCVDEFHRTSSIKFFQNQIIQDMREGRKWKLSISLVSQLIDDFSSDMLKQASTKYILSGGDGYKEICEKFNITGDIREIVRTELNGPTHEGVPFVVKHSTTSGDFTQFLYGTMSPMEMWAFTSTEEDVDMIERAELAFGENNALNILSKAFPEGSIKKKVEQMSTSEQYKDLDDPIGYIMKKVKEKYKDLVII